MAAEDRQLTRSAGVVGFFTLLSRILGLIRDAVVAALFPKGSTDAFFVAYTIPNVLRRLLAEGALTVAFIPVFTETVEKEGRERARQMLANMLGAVLLILTLVTAVGMLGSSWLVKLFAFGLVDEENKFTLASALTQVMFPFLLAVGLTGLAMGVLNTLRHFAAPALAPVVLNIGILAVVLGGRGIMATLGWPDIMALGLGVVVGGFAQNALQLPFLKQHGMLVSPRLNLRDPGVIKVGMLMLPSVFGLAIYEINVVLARQFASFLPEGAISYLYYAQRLIEFPMGIFAVAIATVSMPNMSSHAASGDMTRLKETFRYALRIVFFIILPASAGLAALAVPITAVLFQRGQFSHAMAVETAVTLLGFLGGLWAGAGVRQTVPMFYAMQDTRTPVAVAVLSLLVYASAAMLMRGPLGTLGLALAVACSSVANFLGLLFFLRRRVGLLGLRAIAGSVLRSGVAAAGSAAGAWSVSLLGDWTRGGRSFANAGILLLSVLVGTLIYLVLCRALHVPELDELIAALRRKRR